ncbi:MAG: biopolymer transporter ExbD [Tannerella sp.]|jgi:biopolymer transport protein ExbD|nr:biopolymer transporter ExbD [Tannerella sp.]
MGKKKRKVPAMNATSSADIAFMLLLFFLLTTSMDTDQGLLRKLPPPPENKDKPDDQKVNKRNILEVLVSSDNRVMCSMEEVTLPQLREKAKEFIENPANAENLPEKEAVEIPLLGSQMVTKKHVISLQCDRGTKYQTYIDVQNELVAAYNELRDVASKKFFGNKKYSELDEDEKTAITKLYPQVISEAEPKKYGEKTTKK